LPILPTSIIPRDILTALRGASNHVPFLQSRASWPLMVTTAIIMATGAWLPSSPIGPWLGFTPLPLLYWPLLALTLFCYVLLTQGVKMWLIRKTWI
jgi:Mg2+-importing ATPase